MVKNLSSWSEQDAYYRRVNGHVTLADHLSEIFFTTVFLGGILTVVFLALDRVVRRVARKTRAERHDPASDGTSAPHPLFVAAEWAIRHVPVGAIGAQREKNSSANLTQPALEHADRSRHLEREPSNFCTECGNGLPATGVKFCPECGTPACQQLEPTVTGGDVMLLQPAWRKIVGDRRRLAVLGIGLLLIVTGDWFLRNREMAQLVEAVENSEEVIEGARDQISGAISDFEARPYPTGKFLSGPSQENYQALGAEIRGAASAGARDVIDTSDQVAAVFVLPWHGKVQKAKSRYLEHAGTWEDRFTAVLADADRWNDAAPEINATFKIAQRAFKDALTPFGLFGAEERVEEIFAS